MRKPAPFHRYDQEFLRVEAMTGGGQPAKFESAECGPPMWANKEDVRNLSPPRPASTWSPIVMAREALPSLIRATVGFTARRILFEDVRLKGAAGLARDDEQRFARSIVPSKDLTGAGSLSRALQLGIPGNFAVSQAQHFGTKVSAHPKDQDMREAAGFGIVSLAQVVVVRQLVSVMPSHPSQLASSVPVQSDASRCHNLRTLPLARQSSAAVLTLPPSLSGGVSLALTRGVVADLLDAQPPPTAGRRRREEFHAVVVSLSGTLSSRCHWAAFPWCLGAATFFGQAVRSFPWSERVERRGRNGVYRSLPISSATYRTSR